MCPNCESESFSEMTTEDVPMEFVVMACAECPCEFMVLNIEAFEGRKEGIRERKGLVKLGDWLLHTPTSFVFQAKRIWGDWVLPCDAIDSGDAEHLGDCRLLTKVEVLAIERDRHEGIYGFLGGEVKGVLNEDS